MSATAPTGDTEYGLSTGHPTFDFSNNFERPFRALTPNLELGVGDSTSPINPLVTRNFPSIGPLAHFQAGFAFPMPFGASFNTDAYEQLPIGDQKTYQTLQRHGNTPAVTVVTGHNVTEDNGFTNSLDLPFGSHLTLSAYYNRSLRLKDDAVSFGITYVLRSVREKNAAKDDNQLMRSIQQELHSAPPASPSPAPDDPSSVPK